ncbi:MAG: hypothetical protein LBL26_03050, partial [Peptococcaceae bacterium]|nr:hypothetical protein [Peptococcaceae bacterium]
MTLLKNTRRFLAGVLAVLLVCMTLPGPVFAESEPLEAVYLDGVNGNDINDGDSTNHAVKTFAKAKALVSDTGVIYITGKVMVSDAQTWSLPGDPDTGFQAMLQRYSGYNGCLVEISYPDGKLTLDDIIIDGNANVNATSEMLFISGGIDNTVVDAVLAMNSGVILQNNKNTSGTGGAVRILGKGARFEMNGGLITGNQANQGGAICLDTGHFIMNGGMITDNSANQEGGGIYYASPPSEGQRFELNGGGLINNTAAAGSGSAIFYITTAAATNRLT